MKTRACIALTGLTVAALAASVSPTAAEEIGVLAKRLADMRGEVETMSDQLAARKNELQEAIRSYSRQKSELELEVQREEMRVQKLRQALAQKRAEVAAQKATNQALGPAVEKQLEAVRGYVKASLPFRVKERLAELDKIEEQYKQGLLAPPRALNRLYGFIEDEMRMTRESGLFSQPVVVEGKEQLADVIRVGMVAMYYKTPQDEFGYTAPENGQWSFHPIEDEPSRKQIRGLFETFKKQIRVGYFELPNALPALPANETVGK